MHTTGAGTQDDLLDYVRATARLLSLPLDAAQLARVAATLARTQAMADSLARVPLAPDDEIAEIYAAAPFPASDPS